MRAEFAVLVRSDLKGKGLGWRLMQHLIAYARAEGLKEIYGQVLAINETMLKMCGELGFEIEAMEGDIGLRLVRLKLGGPASGSAGQHDEIEQNKQQAAEEARKRHPPRAPELACGVRIVPQLDAYEREVDQREHREREARRQIGELRDRQQQAEEEHDRHRRRRRYERRLRRRADAARKHRGRTPCRERP